jgi:hypothetical protein
VKAGDLVIDDRSHMNKSNWFYNAWLRYGLILELNDTAAGIVTVAWWRHGKLDSIHKCPASKLELISEGNQ